MLDVSTSDNADNAIAGYQGTTSGSNTAAFLTASDTWGIVASEIKFQTATAVHLLPLMGVGQ